MISFAMIISDCVCSDMAEIHRWLLPFLKPALGILNVLSIYLIIECWTLNNNFLTYISEYGIPTQFGYL